MGCHPFELIDGTLCHNVPAHCGFVSQCAGTLWVPCAGTFMPLGILKGKRPVRRLRNLGVVQDAENAENSEFENPELDHSQRPEQPCEKEIR